MVNFRLENGRLARINGDKTIAVIEPQEEEIEDSRNAKKLLSWTRKESETKNWRSAIVGFEQLKDALKEFDFEDPCSLVLSISSEDEQAGGAALLRITSGSKIVICAGMSEVF